MWRSSIEPVRPKVVALGGGHGLSASLRALRQITEYLTAVVTVADDGGSSGRLRNEIGGIPPGDLRMALAALCPNNASGRAWAKLLQRRFVSTGPLNGHAVGNLLIESAWQDTDFVSGLDLVGNLIGIVGRVLPMSTIPLEIEADVIEVDRSMSDEARVVFGQHKVAITEGEVMAVRLVPDSPPVCKEAAQAIMDADYIVLGPGSWFTSVLPHLLVPDLAAAIVNSPGKRVLTLNVDATNETKGFSAARHIEVLAEHAPMLRLDYVIADNSFVKDETPLRNFVASLGGELVMADVRMRDGSARHETLRLASVYSDLMYPQAGA